MISQESAASAAAAADKCPVDHKARTAWLEQHEQQQQASKTNPPNPPHPTQKQDATSATQTSSATRATKTRPLSQDREVSTIPRADLIAAAVAAASSAAPPNAAPAASHGAASSRLPPANAEVDSGADARSGNWVYPSEKMFFEAMRRKNHDPKATDMASIVPIHNAVNERAWKEIRQWEAGRGWAAAANARCGGPRLRSFAGDSSKLTPRARWNTLIGYQAPFDRHDWVIERCPGEPPVEYVIDFYAGRDDGTGRGLNFYLDVRPKLNTWEGWKMRAARLVGL